MDFNIKQATEQEEIEWQKWYEGDSYTIDATRISFNDERKCFYLINENDNVGTSVYATNPENSKYPDSTPHGMRLVNAICRVISLHGELNDTTIIEGVDAHIKEHGKMTVSVAKNDKNLVVWTVA